MSAQDVLVKMAVNVRTAKEVTPVHVCRASRERIVRQVSVKFVHLFASIYTFYSLLSPCVYLVYSKEDYHIIYPIIAAFLQVYHGILTALNKKLIFTFPQIAAVGNNFTFFLYISFFLLFPFLVFSNIVCSLFSTSYL